VKHERATEEIRELAALYALGSLTQHEADSFEIHMREGCSICEAEFRRFEHIIAGIGFAVDEVAPPDYVRDLLLARIEREQPPAAPTDSKNKPSESQSPLLKPAFAGAPKLLFAQQPPKHSNLFSWTLAALLALLILFTFFIWKSGRDTIDQLQANAYQMQTNASAANTDLNDLKALLAVQKGRIDELDQILSIVNNPGAKILRLTGQTVSPSSAGVVLWEASEGKFLAFGVLPPTPEGKIFQLWFLSPTASIPACSLKLNSNGRFFVSKPIPRDAANATAAAVTLEPDNSSKFPTRPFYAKASID
jgi:anti-sigma-K factor RskA